MMMYTHLEEMIMMHSHLKENEISMLRAEIEMLMAERQSLLKIAGAAAQFIAKLDIKILSGDTYESARLLSGNLNDLSEETLCEALEQVRKKPLASE